MPSGVIDRLEECWAPLIAIADAAGGEWPERAAKACTSLANVDQEQSIGVGLLADIRTAFGDNELMRSVDLVDKLIADDEAPWGDWNGKPIDARWLARRLKRYGIKPGSHKFPGDVTLRGYLRSAFEDAWSRYLPPDCNECNECNAPARDVADVADVADRGGEQKQADDAPWSDHSYDGGHDW
jgi:hypothetical protein